MVIGQSTRNGQGGTTLRYYVHGRTYIDERAVLHDSINDADYYYVPRELHTVEALVNNRGHEVERYSYDAYGQPQITIINIKDVTYDGVLSTADWSAVNGYAGQDPCVVGPFYDVNGDGQITLNENTLSKPVPPALVTSPVSGVGNPYAFTGRRMGHIDDYGLLLYHYRARTYDPQHGRFLQRDPMLYVDGMNLYEYVRSSPIVGLDPTGEAITLDTVQDIGFLAFDLSVGAGLATITIDIAAIIVPFVPNLNAIRRFSEGGRELAAVSGTQTLRNITRIDESLLAETLQRNLRRQGRELGGSPAHRIVDDMARREALLRSRPQLEYLGRRTQPTAYEVHFDRRRRSIEELKSIATRGKKSKWAPWVENADVQRWIQDAFDERFGRGGAIRPTRRNMNFAYDTWLGPGAPRRAEPGQRLSRRDRWVGVANGECTIKIQIKVANDGSVHAFPWPINH